MKQIENLLFMKLWNMNHGLIHFAEMKTSRTFQQYRNKSIFHNE